MVSPLSSSASLGFYDFGTTQSLKDAPAGESEAAHEARLWKVASAFESVILRQILKTMRNSPLAEDILAQSSGSKMAREMHDDQLAVALAENDREGLARDIYQELKRLERSDPVPSGEGHPLPYGSGPEPRGLSLPGEAEQHGGIPLERGDTPGGIPWHGERALPFKLPSEEVENRE